MTASKTKQKKSAPTDMVAVIIPKPYNIVGDTETVAAVNGHMYQIQYDKPVMVPRNVAEIIAQSKDLQARIMELTDQGIMKPGKKAFAEL